MSMMFFNPLFTLLSGDVAMKADTILESDPHGLIVALISISVVLSALIVLAIFVWLFSRGVISLAKRQSERSQLKSMKSSSSGVVHDVEDEVSAEVIAAIGFALKLHKDELHDKESEVITINNVARAYSPWSSRIYGLTRNPRR